MLPLRLGSAPLHRASELDHAAAQWANGSAIADNEDQEAQETRPAIIATGNAA